MIRTIDWRSCKSVSDTGEQVALERWAHLRYDEVGSDIFSLEIGSAFGESTAILAQFGEVLSIDLHGEGLHDLSYPDVIGQVTFQPFIQNMIRLGLIGRVHAMVTTSEFLKKRRYMGFDLVFIDAGHEYEMVRDDLKYSIPHLKIDGMLIVDDYRRPLLGETVWSPEQLRAAGCDPYEGCVRAIDEFMETQGFEVVEQARGKALIRSKK